MRNIEKNSKIKEEEAIHIERKERYLNKIKQLRLIDDTFFNS